MSNTREYRTMSVAEQVARDNSIFTLHTDKWSMHVRPWFSMDRLRFSFVEKGTQGKGNSFDICMYVTKYGAPCFAKWVNDILRRPNRFEAILRAEKDAGNQFPTHYKYVTGNNAEKSIGICNSTKGNKYCINASITREGKKVFCNIPIDFDDLYLLCQNFEEAYAERKAELIRLRQEAENNAERFNSSREEDEEPTENSNPPQTEQPATQNAPAEQSPSSNTGTAPAPERELRVNVNGYVKDQDGIILVGMVSGTSDPVNLYVSNRELYAEKDSWTRFQKMLTAKGEAGVAVSFIVKDTEIIRFK